jgi:hypothetical protein
MFSLWAIAKPNYYVPCLPGLALLIGASWMRLTALARRRDRRALVSRVCLQSQWVLIFVSAAIFPLATRSWVPASAWPWTMAIALVIDLSVIASVLAWRRGADRLCLPPIATAFALAIAIAYGEIAPSENHLRSHRGLAESIRRAVPGGIGSLRFFNEIDEGLWFYLGGLELVPVPGTQPRYNPACDLIADYRARTRPWETLADLDARRRSLDERHLIEWLDRSPSGRSYLLIRNDDYDRLAADLGSRTTPLHRESGMKRCGLTLLRADVRPPLVEVPSSLTRR